MIGALVATGLAVCLLAITRAWLHSLPGTEPSRVGLRADLVRAWLIVAAAVTILALIAHALAVVPMGRVVAGSAVVAGGCWLGVVVTELRIIAWLRARLGSREGSR